jgi:hypothetical protein
MGIIKDSNYSYAIYLCVTTDCTLKNARNNPIHPDTDNTKKPKTYEYTICPKKPVDILSIKKKTEVLILDLYTTDKMEN